MRYSAPLYGVIRPKNRMVFSSGRTQALLGFAGCEFRMWNGIVDSERNDRNFGAVDAKLFEQLLLHLLGVHENMVGKLILDAQRKPVQPGIAAVAFARIYIVRCEYDPFPETTVVQHEQRAVKVLKFIVPENMENSWLRLRSVAEEAWRNTAIS